MARNRCTSFVARNRCISFVARNRCTSFVAKLNVLCERYTVVTPAQVDINVLQMSSEEACSVMETIKTETNIHWHKASFVFTITGSFTEIQRARKRLMYVLGGEVPVSSLTSPIPVPRNNLQMTLKVPATQLQ